MSWSTSIAVVAAALVAAAIAWFVYRAYRAGQTKVREEVKDKALAVTKKMEAVPPPSRKQVLDDLENGNF